MYVYIITKKKKRLNKLFIRCAQIFGPAAFLGGAKTDSYLYIFLFPCFSLTRVCVCVYIYVCAHVRACVCVRARTHVCVWDCLAKYMYVMYVTTFHRQAMVCSLFGWQAFIFRYWSKGWIIRPPIVHHSAGRQYFFNVSHTLSLHYLYWTSLGLCRIHKKKYLELGSRHYYQ